MKNTIQRLSGLLVISLFLMGCPYSTKIELTGEEKVNEKYFGMYEKQSTSYYYLQVSKFSNTEYKLEKYRTSTKTVSQTGIGKIYSIKGNQFLVVKKYRSTGYTTDLHYIYKFTPSSSGYIIRLQGVSDYITEKFETEKDLRKYLEKYSDVSFFYQKKIDKYYKSDE